MMRVRKGNPDLPRELQVVAQWISILKTTSKKNTHLRLERTLPRCFFSQVLLSGRRNLWNNKRAKPKRKSQKVLLMEEILHQLIDSLIHDLQSLNNIPGGRDLWTINSLFFFTTHQDHQVITDQWSPINVWYRLGGLPLSQGFSSWPVGWHEACLWLE